jgi:hypothetical protein
MSVGDVVGLVAVLGALGLMGKALADEARRAASPRLVPIPVPVREDEAGKPRPKA